MNFDLSEEQQMLKDSVARFVEEQYDFDTRRKLADSPSGFSPENWQTFAELGWLSVPFAEQYGGFGGSAVDVMVVMEELGRGLVLEPYVATVLLFGGLLSKSANDELKQSLIGDIIEGRLQGAFAYLERRSRFEITDVTTTAEEVAEGFLINGTKTLVGNGMAADKFIVSARSSGGQSDADGISLFLVDANADGVNRNAIKLMDGQVVANLTLDNVRVSTGDLVSELDQGHALMASVINEVLVALSAEALGIMQKLHDTTVEYSKTRKQFGVPIGSFQVLQHRMVDMFMAHEQTRSLLYRAVCSLEQGESDAMECEKNILALKVMVGRAGGLIGAESIQLHGGMGMTDELDVGHYVKRLMTIDTMFGDADFSEQRFSALTNGAGE